MYNYKSAFEQEAQVAIEQENSNKNELIRDSEIRLANFIKNIREQFNAEDPEVLFLIQSQIEQEFYNEQYKQIDDVLNSLFEKSEALIESPEANTSVVLEQRSNIKDNINFLFEIQELLKKGLERAEINRIKGLTISREKHNHADKIIADIRKEIDMLFAEPPNDLN